jgi:hypothetical protein
MIVLGVLRAAFHWLTGEGGIATAMDFTFLAPIITFVLLWHVIRPNRDWPRREAVAVAGVALPTYLWVLLTWSCGGDLLTRHFSHRVCVTWSLAAGAWLFAARAPDVQAGVCHPRSTVRSLGRRCAPELWVPEFTRQNVRNPHVQVPEILTMSIIPDRMTRRGGQDFRNRLGQNFWNPHELHVSHARDPPCGAA